MRLSFSGRLLCLLAIASAALLGPRLPMTITDLGSAQFDVALLAVLTLIQIALSAWVLGTVLVAAVTGHSIAPAALQRLLFTGAVGALLITPAHAGTEHTLDGLRLPERPSIAVAVPVAPQEPRRVVVEPADTLWKIAADDLPPNAGNTAIAQHVKLWHESNHDVIGDDPDLLHPGQRLTAPGSDHA